MGLMVPSLGGPEKHGCSPDGQVQILPLFLGSSLFARGCYSLGEAWG